MPMPILPAHLMEMLQKLTLVKRQQGTTSKAKLKV